MAPQLQFFDMNVSVTPPKGNLEPLPVPLGPNWQPNDLRILLVSGSGTAGLEMQMNPDPPTGLTAAYVLNSGIETHGVYYRRLISGDADTVSVAWAKPQQWEHFMFSVITVRGVSPTVSPVAGWLHMNQTSGDTTVVAQSVAVPGSGIMIFFAGSVPTPWANSTAPTSGVSMGAPSGWTNLVATDKSGVSYYPYGTDPSLIVVAKRFSAAGSTGLVSFPSAQGVPAFSGLYVFLTSALDVSMTIAAA